MTLYHIEKKVTTKKTGVIVCDTLMTVIHGSDNPSYSCSLSFTRSGCLRRVRRPFIQIDIQALALF